ncbi:MAG: hypothetical protein ACI8UR_002194 [Natronomonas sp.]|jgi:uncharacterized protein YceH (UPF0502 family)|uniref:hypothetical protein n=1 Tax=Natronomonas sp. TaxID=2184060 RepID=UPI00398A0065
MHDELEAASLEERIVLGCIIDLADREATPANSAEIREAVTAALERVDSGTVGRLSEADVMRSLNALAETELVEEKRPEDGSPVGKGRPTYSLGADDGTVQSMLAEDDRVAPLVE